MKKWKTNRRKYVVSINIFLVYVLLCMLTFFYFVNKNVSSNIIKNIGTAVSGGNAGIELQLHERMNLLYMAADYTYHLGKMDQEGIQDLSEMLMEEDFFSVVFFADATGKTLWDDGTKSNIFETEFFTRVIAGDEVMMRGVADEERQTRYLVLGIPIIDEQNQTKGVIGGYCDMSLLAEEVFQDIYDGKGYVFLSTSDGAIDAWRYPDGLKPQKGDFGGSYEDVKIAGGGDINHIKSDKEKGNNRSILYTQGGIEYYMSYQKMEYYPDGYLNFVVEAKVPQEDFRFILQYELILVIAIAAGLLLLVFVLVRYLLQSRKQLMEKAQMDALTGLLNKESTKEEIVRFLAEDGKHGTHAMLVVDVDGFKGVNDTFGHIAGDKILAGLSKVMEEVFRAGDIIGRMGGDEYMLLLKDIKDIQVLRKRLDTFCTHFREFEMEEYPGLHISCSIGVAIYPEVGNTYMELYEKADAALYRAKGRGRNGYVIYCR